MFDMDVARCAPYMEHDGSFNMLHAVVAYMDQFQKGLGAVAVSPRCGVVWLGEAVWLTLPRHGGGGGVGGGRWLFKK